MKIPLNMGQGANLSTAAAQAKALERDLLAAKRGDWTAKNNLIHTFLPLIAAMAEKRTEDKAQLNAFIEGGKAGLLKAAAKFKLKEGPVRFQIFAVEYIESSMDRAVLRDGRGGGLGGFLARLFGRKG